MKKYISSSVVFNVVWVLMIMGVVLGFPSSPFKKGFPAWDSAVFITCADMLNHGKTMYVDFFDHKGPLMYLFDWLGLKIGGITGLWVLEIVWFILSANLMYLIARIFTTKFASFIGTMCGLAMVLQFECHNSVEFVALPFVCLGLWPLLKSIHDDSLPSYKAAIVSSVCLGITVLLKPNIGSLIVFCMLSIAISCIGKKEYALLWKYVFICLGILSVMGLIVYLWLKSYSAWNCFVGQFWDFNIEYSHRFSLLAKLKSGIRLIFLTTLCSVSWLMSVFVLFGNRKDGQSFKENLTLFLILFLSSFISCGLAGNEYAHYLIAIVPGYVIFISKGISMAKNIKSKILVGLLLLVYGYSYTYNLYASLRNISSVSSNYTELNSAVDYVQAHTAENDEICLYGVDPMLYYLSGRIPCTRYIYQWVVFKVRSDAREEYFNEIRQKQPKLIVVAKDKIASLPEDISAQYLFEETSGCEYKFLIRKKYLKKINIPIR